jgi:uncharacterized protein
MQEVPKEQILRRIALENPWWSPPHEVSQTFTRWTPRPYMKLFYPLVSKRKVRRAPVLMGPRRVGKTVLIHHCIACLLRDGVPPKHICYISVDSPIYVNCSPERFLELYSEATGVSVIETPTHFFFDEIQYLRDWERHIKSLVDTYPHILCTASGSAAAALRLKSNESGAGRFTDFLLPPLTFHEYLELQNKNDLVDAELRDETYFYSPIDLAELNSYFETYINFGGYPEVAFSPEIQDNPERFIKSDIIDKVLLRDLPSLYGIKDIQELNALFTSLAFNTAQEIALEELAQRSGVAKPTIKRYIEYLEAAFLIRVVHRVDEKARHFLRARNFKVYLTNPSLRTALFGSTNANDQIFGSLVETGVFAQWFHAEGQNLHYARWKQGELDIVSLRPDQRVQWAVEVKWSDRHVKNPALMRDVLAFCTQNNLRQLIVTTRTASDKKTISNVEVDFWPASLYAFAVGHSVIDRKVLALA